MDLDPQILSVDKRNTNNAIAGFIVGAITRTSSTFDRLVLALRGVVPVGEIDAPKTRSPTTSRNWYLVSLIAFFAIPSFLCIIYLVFIASDQFVSEARFAVRTAQLGPAQDPQDSETNRLGGGSSIGTSMPVIANQDAYIIANYIASRTIIDDLASKINIRAIFQRPEADFWARLPSNASVEDLTNYWRKMVSAYVDATSGIVIVTVRTFRPTDSEMLAQAILDLSEKLANDVSARVRTSVMHDAEAEVRRSEGLVETALNDMRKFRDVQGFIDPLSAATSTSTLLLETMSQKIQTENDYFVASKVMSSDAPSVVSLKRRLDALDSQITELRSQLTSNSPSGRTISASLTTFEELELKRMFAEKLYTMAEDALERAKLRAEQKHIYVMPFVQPSVPQEAEFPQRFSLCIILPAAIFILWAIFAMLASSIEDHRN